MSDSFNIDSAEKISGVVEKIKYQNDQNGYTVAILKSGREHITVVGVLPFVSEGDNLKLSGKFVVNPSYGNQFSIESFEHQLPKTAATILRCLSSGIIKGVGPSTATRIVEKFGDDTLDIIQNHPEELSIIRGISKEKALLISKEYSKQYGVRDIMLLLSPYEVTLEKCIKIFKRLGTDATYLIKENPYILCDSSINLKFELVEKVAHDFGISSDNHNRLEAGIIYILRENLLNGHTCLPRHKLLCVAQRLLESNESRINNICDNMISQFKVISEKIDNTDFISLPEYANAERYISVRLSATKENLTSICKIDDLEIEYLENKLGIKFEQLQKQAIKDSFDTGILVLTGGPGTGKTTTLNAIIKLFEMRNLNISLTAPTGRAAKRMSELTGMESMTIHRLLEVEWTDEENSKFARNEKNPLECDVIIIDEASMIDSLLFESLLRSLKLSCRIILVGDADQLPSVSAGNVLSDIISSEKFPVIRLRKIFRQKNESLIIKNAHAIINKTPIDFSNSNDDFFILKRHSSSEVCDTVVELCSERLPKAYGFDSLKNIQVLCPSKKLDTGTLNLNNLLQQYLNPKKANQPHMSYKGVYMRVGDKVMQIRNNYEVSWIKDDGEIGTGVYNGDVGFISDIDMRAGTLKVRFDDRTATYITENIGELELAYAITVHKSQGSEFDCVIIPIIDVPSQLRYRNILYTAVTRAKRLLIIVGNENIVTQMADNDKKTLRYTLLKGYFDEV